MKGFLLQNLQIVQEKKHIWIQFLSAKVAIAFDIKTLEKWKIVFYVFELSRHCCL